HPSGGALMASAYSPWDRSYCEGQPIGFTRNCHACAGRPLECEKWRVRNVAKLVRRILIGSIACERDPALSFIMEDEKVFGLIRVAIAAAVVIESEGDVALKVLSDK
ncbi:MAG TPA: hypothetical protein VIR79_05940, partial [Nitrospira sp.]